MGTSSSEDKRGKIGRMNESKTASHQTELLKTKFTESGKESDQIKNRNAKRMHNNALNHDRPHLQPPLVRRRLVLLQERFVVCVEKMRS